MRALITGVTGFVGSHLAEHLLGCGDTVVGISRRGVWTPDVPDSVQRRVPVYSADLTNSLEPSLTQQIADWAPEAVYHLAAISVPSECGAESPTAPALATNVQGTRRLIELVLSLNKRPRVVFSGSCYVYGAVPYDNPVVSEASLCDPDTGYGVTKLAAEQVLRSAAEDQHLDVVIARAFQHTGPRQSLRKIVPDWARQLTAPGDAPLRAICLDTYLDLSDVRDIVRAYRMLAVSGGANRIYNIGSGVGHRSGELLEIMRRLCHSSKEIVEVSPGWRQHPVADTRRIHQEVGWQPRIPIEQTLQDVLQYWQHRSGVST